jgi:hypothetical protein
MDGLSDSFDKIKDSVSIQIFKINANVKGIEKLVDRLNGGAGVGVRDNLSVLLPFLSCRLRHDDESHRDRWDSLLRAMPSAASSAAALALSVSDDLS